jgi:hypothetical protein
MSDTSEITRSFHTPLTGSSPDVAHQENMTVPIDVANVDNKLAQNDPPSSEGVAALKIGIEKPEKALSRLGRKCHDTSSSSDESSVYMGSVSRKRQQSD